MEQCERVEKNSSRNTTSLDGYNFNFGIFQYNQTSIHFLGCICNLFYILDDTWKKRIKDLSVSLDYCP